MTPEVSVLIPAYNAALTLERAVESLLAQTVDCWEAVIVDDNSEDDTLAVARRLAARDPRVRVYAMGATSPEVAGEHRGTPFLARCEAVSHARGRYVCCLDADDFLEPPFIEKQLRRAAETGARIVLASLNCGSEDDPEGRHVYPAPEVDMATVAPGRDFIKWSLYFWRVTFIGALIERQIFQAVSMEPHAMTGHPYYDELAVRMMLLRADCVALSTATYHEVRHEGSLTSLVSPRAISHLTLLPAIDGLITEAFGPGSHEHDLAALHLFTVWIDWQRRVRRASRASGKGNKQAITEKQQAISEMQRAVDATVLTLPMPRLRRLLSPRYLAIVVYHRLRARLRL